MPALLLRALVALLLATTVGCSVGGPPPATSLPADVGAASPSPRVTVDDNVFSPEEVVVAAGDTVTWEWVGRAPHDVVGDGFASETQAAGSFTHTFEATGSYPYVCTLHPGMQATVHVVAAEG